MCRPNFRSLSSTQIAGSIHEANFRMCGLPSASYEKYKDTKTTTRSPRESHVFNKDFLRLFVLFVAIPRRRGRFRNEVSMADRLQHQVAWISGAASGIGEAVARLFAEEGAAVGLADVQTAKGSAAADDIRKAGGQAIFVECDVGREEHVRSSIE